MKNLKINGSKAVFGSVRMAYVHLLSKYNPDNNDATAKYCVTILIPKTDKEAIAAISGAIEAAKQDGKAKWGGKIPANCAPVLKDGDTREEAEFHGNFFFTAKSKTRPHVVDRALNPLTEEDDVYSGMYGNVSVTFFPYSTGGNKGIGAILNNVQKTKDGERMGGKASAQSDFGGMEEDDDEDL